MAKSGDDRLFNFIREVTRLRSKDFEQSFFWFGYRAGAVVRDFDIGVR